LLLLERGPGDVFPVEFFALGAGVRIAVNHAADAFSGQSVRVVFAFDQNKSTSPRIGLIQVKSRMSRRAASSETVKYKRISMGCHLQYTTKQFNRLYRVESELGILNDGH